MVRLALFLLSLLAALVLSPRTAPGAGDLTGQQPVEVRVLLGDEKDALKFVPDALEFETGKLYRMVLVNPSPQKHYFSSEGFSRAVFTRKVQVNGGDGKPVAEVKGVVHEIEVYPGGIAEWWFVPVRAGAFDDLKCTIPGHAEKGMVGRITVR